MCYDANGRPPIPDGTQLPVKTDDAVLTSRDGVRFNAFIAQPETPPVARLVILPDVRGLHGFYKDLANRFAQKGIAAVAFDYFGRTAGLTARDDSFEYAPHVKQLMFDTVVSDMMASLEALSEHKDVPAFNIGFCLGGAFVLLTATKDLPFTGSISFYAALAREVGGAHKVLDVATSMTRPILAMFGGDDVNIPNDQVQAFDEALDRSGVNHTVVSYPGAPHSFFDRRFEEFTEESAHAWARVLSFIAAHPAFVPA